MKRIFAIQPNFEIKYYDSIENAKKANPFAVLEQAPGPPYTSNSGNIYQTTYYKVLDELNDYFELGVWKVFSSEFASYDFITFSHGFSTYQFQYKVFFSSVLEFAKEQGIMNYFQIADCKGEIKIVKVRSFPELIHNLKEYIRFNTWEEVMLYIENQKLKIAFEKLKNEKTE